MTADIHMRRRAILRGALAAAVSGGWSARQASAQGDYPARPVSLVVPFPAGGPTDGSARLYAKQMAETLGQPIVIDNRAGAAGTVGSAYVARAANDGYTLLWGGTTTLAVAPGLYRNLRYEPQSFVPIGMALRGQMMIAAHPSTGLGSLAELVQRARAQDLTIATAGEGSIGHLGAVLLSETAGIKLTHVPYKGGAPALTDAIGGQVALIFETAATLAPAVKAGRLRALAATGAQPYAPLADVPLAKAVLAADYEVYSWFGLVAPGGTPDVVVQRLQAAMAKAAQAAEVTRQLADSGVEPGIIDARAFGAIIDADFRKWSGVIARAGIRVE